MKIAVLSMAEVSNLYIANLLQCGHTVIHGPFGHVDGGVQGLVDDGVNGVLLFSKDDAVQETAARFTRATGRPVWRELAEIPRDA